MEKPLVDLGPSWKTPLIGDQTERPITSQNSNVCFCRSYCSVTKPCLLWTPWTAACLSLVSFIISWSLLKFMSTESVMPSNCLILCCTLLLLPSILPSIRLFTSGGQSIGAWPKYWSFSFSISPSSEYSGLISFMIDWFDLLAVQGSLKILLQHHLKASVLWCSVFFMEQLSHPNITTGKIIDLAIQNFFSKVMYMIFSMLSKFVLPFFPRSKLLTNGLMEPQVFQILARGFSDACQIYTSACILQVVEKNILTGDNAKLWGHRTTLERQKKIITISWRERISRK